GVEGEVATFYDFFHDSGGWQNPVASIAWGDGTTSTPTIIEDSSHDGSGTLTASHTYVVAGTYFGSITITDPSTYATELFEADVDDQLLSGGGGPGLGWRGIVGIDTAATLQTFTDPDPNANVNLYNSIVKWGDGATSNGTITQTGASFTVTGDHTYSTPGSYSVYANVLDVGGATSGITAPL